LDCSQPVVRKSGYISRKKMTTGPLANACKTSLSSQGGKTTITPKHLSILHAITLQECRVFERYGVKITLMNLIGISLESQPSNNSAANVSASSVNIEGTL